MGLYGLADRHDSQSITPPIEKMLGREINGLDGTIAIEGMRPRAYSPAEKPVVAVVNYGGGEAGTRSARRCRCASISAMGVSAADMRYRLTYDPQSFGDGNKVGDDEIENAGVVAP